MKIIEQNFKEQNFKEQNCKGKVCKNFTFYILRLHNIQLEIVSLGDEFLA